MSERELGQFRNVLNNLNRDGIIRVTNFNDKSCAFIANGTTVELSLNNLSKALNDLTKGINKCRMIARKNN